MPMVLTLQDDADSMRAVKFGPAYQLSFSLMNGASSSMLEARWDIEQALQGLCSAFTTALNSLFIRIPAALFEQAHFGLNLLRQLSSNDSIS